MEKKSQQYKKNDNQERNLAHIEFHLYKDIHY